MQMICPVTTTTNPVTPPNSIPIITTQAPTTLEDAEATPETSPESDPITTQVPTTLEENETTPAAQITTLAVITQPPMTTTEEASLPQNQIDVTTTTTGAPEPVGQDPCGKSIFPTQTQNID